ncbi:MULTISPECIES: hypothetical protein [unclassified Nocardioides]|uniref:hypothetical protein n=1 Tax=unclassified Nocardioides TaxID=2615069 RepID=UPI003014EA2F
MSDSTPPRPAELVLQAVTTVAWIAVPDYVTRPWPRRVTRLAILAGTTGAYLLLERPSHEEPDLPDGPPSKLAVAKVTAAVVASFATARGTKRLTAAAVRRLEARGVRRPWTVAGVGMAAVTAGMRAADARRVVLHRE